MSQASAITLPLSGYRSSHFRLAVEDGVALVTLDRP